MIDPKTIEQVKAANAGVKLFGVGDIIVRPPKPAEYRKFKTKGAGGPAARIDAMEALVRDCLIHPDQAAFTAMLEERPALVDVLVDKVLELAGIEAKDLEVVPL